MSPDENAQFNAQFNQIIGADNEPYGPTATPPHKPGLTARGKAILGAAGVVLAAGGFLVYQDHAANVAAQEAKTAEIALQQQRLELERLKVMNKVDEEQAKEQKAESKSLQAKIDACVQDNKDQSAYLQGVVDACRDQYSTTSAVTDGGDIEAAGSAVNAGSAGGIDPLWAVGGIAAATGIAIGAKRMRRPAQPTYY